MASNASKIGHVMYFLFWLLVFAILLFVFDVFLRHRDNPNQTVETTFDQRTKTVVLRRNPQGHYRVTGRINGMDVTMLVDTGATTVALPYDLAMQLGLSLGPRLMSSTANGDTEAYQTHLNRVQVGDISVHNVRAMILPNMRGDVLLGMTFLRELSFTQRGKSLLLQQGFE